MYNILYISVKFYKLHICIHPWLYHHNQYLHITPKLSSSLTPLPNHSQATMVTLYFPEIYIHQNYIPCTHFSLLSCNQHNYFDLHSYVQYIPFCCWVGSHCVGRTQLIYTLTCSSCCRYYWMWLCVDICSHSFWVKNRKELVRLYGIRF